MTVGPDPGIIVGCFVDERGPTAFHSWSSEADDGEICLLITDAIRQHFFEYADSSWQNLECRNKNDLKHKLSKRERCTQLSNL